MPGKSNPGVASSLDAISYELAKLETAVDESKDLAPDLRREMKGFVARVFGEIDALTAMLDASAEPTN